MSAMTYLIDAWLDRPHPYLRILHRETGEICAVLKKTRWTNCVTRAAWTCTS